jgi:hypothetical protein
MEKKTVFYPKVDINNLILGNSNKGVFHDITKHLEMVTFIPSHEINVHHKRST